MHKIMFFLGLIISVFSVLYGIFSTNVLEGFIGVIGGIGFSLLQLFILRSKR